MLYQQLNVQLECGVLAKAHVYVRVMSVCATLPANKQHQRKIVLVNT